jgi:hypothetical protein
MYLRVLGDTILQTNLCRSVNHLKVEGFVLIQMPISQALHRLTYLQRLSYRFEVSP